MPKFYIHFRNRDRNTHQDLLAKDDEGQEFPGLAEAKEAALVSAREILADNIKGDAKSPLEAVIISNGSGQDVMTILTRDILPEPLK
jgi:hypothetical protein